MDVSCAGFDLFAWNWNQLSGEFGRDPRIEKVSLVFCLHEFVKQHRGNGFEAVGSSMTNTNIQDALVGIIRYALNEIADNGIDFEDGFLLEYDGLARLAGMSLFFSLDGLLQGCASKEEEKSG